MPKGRTFVAAHKNRKYAIMPSASSGAILANSTTNDPRTVTGLHDNCGASDDGSKKPLIAKWKAGAKVHNAMSPVTFAQNESHGL